MLAALSRERKMFTSPTQRDRIFAATPTAHERRRYPSIPHRGNAGWITPQRDSQRPHPSRTGVRHARTRDK